MYIKSLVSLFMLLAVLAPGSFAQKVDREVSQELVSRFWALDQRAQKVMESVSKWSEKYQTDQVISAASSQELKLILREAYKIAVEARRIKRATSKSRDKFLSNEKFKALYDNREDVSETQLFELLMHSLTDLVMYEQLSFFFHLVADDKTMMKRLNEVVVFGLRDHFDRLQKAWMHPFARKRFAKSLKGLDDFAPMLEEMQKGGNLYIKSLRERLDTYMAYEIRNSGTFWGRIGQYFKLSYRFLRVRARKRLNWMEYYLSKIFGNAAGAMNIQKFLNSIPEKELKRVRTEVLMPGDLIVEKTAGAITDKFIPGHFGHVALVFGTYDQVKDLKLSSGRLLVDTDLYKQHAHRLNEGETTIEAIRPGTTLVNIEEWTITDLAVLRAVNYPREKLGDVLYQALSYVGTQYDFAFDVNTRSIVVCSELPYQAYKGVNFRIAQQAGRWTISPDDVAVLAGEKDKQTPNRPFELIYFNHETKEVPAAKSFKLYLKSLKAEKSRYDEVPENDLDYSDL